MKIEKLLTWFLDQWPIKILSLSIAVLLYFFTSLVDMKTESITLPIHYNLPNAMVQAQDYPQTVKIHLRGSGKTMEVVKPEDLQVYVDFSFAHEEGLYQAPVRIRNKGNESRMDSFDMELEPSLIELRLEKISYKEVPVRIVFDGEPRTGHEILNYSVIPSRVRVSGPRGRIASLSQIETDPVELASRTSSFTQRLHVRSPNQLLAVTNIDTVEIKVEISESSLPMVFSSIRIVTQGLASHLDARLSQDAVKVQIESTNSILQSLDDHQIQVSLDLSGYTNPGQYTVPLSVVLPDEVKLVELQPSEVQVTIRNKADNQTGPAAETGSEANFR